jgi:hypothetical protein
LILIGLGPAFDPAISRLILAAIHPAIVAGLLSHNPLITIAFNPAGDPANGSLY